MTSKIGWCDETINPFTGCRQGCRFCYARRMAHRFANIHGTVYERVDLATSSVDPETGWSDGGGNPFAPAIHLDVLVRHLGRLGRARCGPRRVFIGSMGDMCFDGTAITFPPDPVLAVREDWDTGKLQEHLARFCSRLPRHTFLLLTKRPDLLSVGVRWPRNVHLGVSLTSNADEHRVVGLLRRGPGVCWASVEPLLDLDFEPAFLTGLDWVVVGAQTGAGAPDAWPVLEAARRVVVWCADNGVPCFVKDNLRKWTLGPGEAWTWPRELPAVPQ